LNSLTNLDTVAEWCRAAVIQGGFGTTAALLGRRLPLLICPLQLEQSLLAWRLGKRGLAHGMSLSIQESAVDAKLTEVLENNSPLYALDDYANRYAAHEGQSTVNVIVKHCLESLN
ncbi:MAG: hypothetical protein HQL55_20320, partial [Magnetococcales bacterium]|nr:hypothetical protein [Magnetococcales bacterium]